MNFNPNTCWLIPTHKFLEKKGLQIFHPKKPAPGVTSNGRELLYGWKRRLFPWHSACFFPLIFDGLVAMNSLKPPMVSNWVFIFEAQQLRRLMTEIKRWSFGSGEMEVSWMEIIDVTQPVNVGWLISDGLAPKKQYLVLMFAPKYWR